MLRLLLDRPRLTLALLAVVAGSALIALPRLEIDFTPRDLYGRSGESAAVSRRITEVFGSRDSVVLILVEAADVLAPEILQYIHELSLHLRMQPYAERVDSITLTRFPRRVRPREGAALPHDADPRAVIDAFTRATLRGEIRINAVVQGQQVDSDEAAALRAVLDDAPLVDGRLVSRDRRVAAVAVALAPHVQRIRDIEPVVTAVDQWLAEHPPPATATVRVTGQPHVDANFARRVRADQRLLMPLSLAVCAAVLWFTFGSVIGVVLPLMAVLTSAGMVLGAMAWLGEPLNILNNITPLLVIVIGLSDSIYLLEHYSVERRRGGDGRAIVGRTVAKLTIACFLTSLTDAIGFASLCAASTELLARFGLTAALGIMIAYLVSLALVPAWLILWTPPLAADRRTAARAATRIAAVFVPASARARYLVLGATLAAVVATGIATSKARVDDTMQGLFEPNDPIYQATLLAERQLNGGLPLDVILESSQPQRFRSPEVLARLDSAQRWVETRPGVLRVSGYSDHLHEVWAVLSEDAGKRHERFVSPAQVEAFDGLLRGSDRKIAGFYANDDGSQTRLSIEIRDIGSDELVTLSEELGAVLRRELAEFPDITFAIGGNAYVKSYGINLFMHDMLGSFGLATVAIGASLLLLSRGLAATLVGVLASVLPQGLVVLYMVLRGMPFNVSTVVIFCISIGLAIDGTIHIFARLHDEEKRGGSSLAILRRAVESTAAGTMSNALTLVLGFAVLTFSQFVPLRQFGELSAVAVVTSLFGTFVLMPTLLDMVGAVHPGRAHVDAADSAP